MLIDPSKNETLPIIKRQSTFQLPPNIKQPIVKLTRNLPTTSTITSASAYTSLVSAAALSSGQTYEEQVVEYYDEFSSLSGLMDDSTEFTMNGTGLTDLPSVESEIQQQVCY